jgi:hypothetical protein
MRSRFALLGLAASGVVGCTDSEQSAADVTAPRAAFAAPAVAPNAAMQSLGGTLGDATGQFLPSAGDMIAQALLRAALADLSKDLEAGDAKAATRHIAEARRLIAKAGDAAAIELAPIGLALDNVELVLKGETPGSAPTSDARTPDAETPQ